MFRYTKRKVGYASRLGNDEITAVYHDFQGGRQTDERQRLAIARAMLKNAPVLILDEATAFADPDNETKVQAAFNALAKGRTVIIIAHRLSTVVNADRIFVLNEGHLSESGSFAELSGQKDSLFGTMWQDYQQSVRWKVEKEV